MKVVFIPPAAGAPSALLSGAEIHFEEPPLAGVKLVGFGVWTGARGVTVSVPARPFKARGRTRHYELLRGIDTMAALKPLKTWIIKEFLFRASPPR